MRLIVLPGDGIGPEIVLAAMGAVEALNDARGLGLAFDRDVIGLESLAQYGTTLRPELAERLPGYDGIVLGPADTAAYPPPEQGGVNISAWMRTRLDLYANIRPARHPISLKGARPSPSTSSSCARSPRASMPTATCSRETPTCSPRPMWRSACAR